MLKLINNLSHALLFYLGIKLTKFKALFFQRTGQHEKVKATKLALKAGDTYRLGESIVTLATFGPQGKLEVAEKIKAIEALRALRDAELTERAEKIMLMSEQELEQLKVNEWLVKVKRKNEKTLYESFVETGSFVAVATKKQNRRIQ